MPKHKPDLSRTRLQAPSRTLLRLAQTFSREFPFLDAGCGFGRNVGALADPGFTVVCADRGLSRLNISIKVTRADRLNGALFSVQTKLGAAIWPFSPPVSRQLSLCIISIGGEGR